MAIVRISDSKINIVSETKRLIVESRDSICVYIPMTKKEKKFFSLKTKDPCWKIELLKESTL